MDQTPQTTSQQGVKHVFQGEINNLQEHHHYWAEDPIKAIKAVVQKNQEYELEVSRLKGQIDGYQQTIDKHQKTIEKHEKTIEHLIKQAPAADRQEVDKITVELALIRHELAAVKRELSVAKADVDTFRIWTKKLDWSTTEGKPPASLSRLFDIQQRTESFTWSDGTQGTRTGQTVDGQWHGPMEATDFDGRMQKDNYCQGLVHGLVQTTTKTQPAGVATCIAWMGKNLNKVIQHLVDGSRQYKFADDDGKGTGVSVGVLDRSDQQGLGYTLKNGYNITLHNYKEQVEVGIFHNGQMITTKWYQLKK